MWVSEINGVSFESNASTFMLFKKVKLNTLRQITFCPCGLNVYDSVTNNFVHYFNIFLENSSKVLHTATQYISN